MGNFVDAGWEWVRQDSSIPAWVSGSTSACEGMNGMRIQTLTRETLARMGDQQLAMHAAPTPSIVAPEGSELAARLRSRGWVARSGWRSRQAGRPPVWLVRFEHPEWVRDAKHVMHNEASPVHIPGHQAANGATTRQQADRCWLIADGY